MHWLKRDGLVSLAQEQAVGGVAAPEPRRGSWHTVTPNEFLPGYGFLKPRPRSFSAAWRSSAQRSHTGCKRFKVPRAVFIETNPPETPIGEIARTALRERVIPAAGMT